MEKGFVPSYCFPFRPDPELWAPWYFERGPFAEDWLHEISCKSSRGWKSLGWGLNDFLGIGPFEGFATARVHYFSFNGSNLFLETSASSASSIPTPGFENAVRPRKRFFAVRSFLGNDCEIGDD
jgi:hypothetical protein